MFPYHLIKAHKTIRTYFSGADISKVPEPFGYSIFQSVDYGKLPILSEDWCSDFEYPYRASTKERFDKIVNIIKKSTYEERNSHFRSLREYLSKYDNKEEWVEKYLRIYNG